jgi:hypothetical protein
MPEPRYGVLNLIERLACDGVVSGDYHARKQCSTAVFRHLNMSVVCIHCWNVQDKELSADMIVYVCPWLGLDGA